MVYQASLCNRFSGRAPPAQSRIASD
jgi:hypothetical protein